jgi:hypothetical protein
MTSLIHQTLQICGELGLVGESMPFGVPSACVCWLCGVFGAVVVSAPDGVPVDDKVHHIHQRRQQTIINVHDERLCERVMLKRQLVEVACPKQQRWGEFGNLAILDWILFFHESFLQLNEL